MKIFRRYAQLGLNNHNCHFSPWTMWVEGRAKHAKKQLQPDISLAGHGFLRQARVAYIINMQIRMAMIQEH